MAADRKHEAAPTWRSIVSSAIDWEEGHASVDAAARGLASELRGRRPDGVPHSAWELLEHIRRTQADLLDFMTNESYSAPEWPRDYWPAPNEAPTDAAWTDCLEAIHADRDALKQLATRESLDLTSRIPWGEGQTYLRCLLLAVDHTSYHVGQMIIVRRLLGAWTDR
jgi:uncharacterized damage-inducible protein DinB